MAATHHKYLDPRQLAGLRHVHFRPRRRVEGLYAGRHPSPQRGRSLEFNDYRPYMPGDEVGGIDWKVYARSDRLYLKRYEHQTDLGLYLLVDASASMAYPEEAEAALARKFDQAARIAAAVAFLLTQQQDRVGLGIARSGLEAFVPLGGSQSHLLRLLAALEQARPGGQAALPEAIEQLGARVRRRCMLLVLSDLLDDAEPILRALGGFAAAEREVVLFHLLHEDELELPPMEGALFTDSESGAQLGLSVEEIRPAYRRRMRRFLEQWRSAAAARGLDYEQVSAAAPHAQVLRRYLNRRGQGP